MTIDHSSVEVPQLFTILAVIAMFCFREKEFSPLLKMLVERDLRARGIATTPKLALVHKLDPLEPVRVAEPGEKPDFDPDLDVSPLTLEELRQGIQL